MVKHSKRFRTATQMADLQQPYPLREAIDLLQRFPKPRFDETVEISAHLGVDPRQSSQMVRGTCELPKGSGKKVRLIAFTENTEEALAAGADEAGLAELIEKIQGGWLDFDVAVATSAAMKEVRKVARVLGPRGMMPNPKSGTVSDDLPGTITAIKKGGRVEFKMDKTGNLHMIIGRRSFSSDDLEENANTAIETLGRARPESFKGRFIKKLTLTATMSPGVSLDPSIYTKL